MKIYFFEDGRKSVLEFTQESDEPKNAVAFFLEGGQSTFAPRYEMEDNTLVDKFPDLNDEEVASFLQEQERLKAVEIADNLAVATVE